MSVRRTWQVMFPAFRLRLTRWGGVFVLLALVMAFAAVNTGNNGLMAVLGVVLGSYIVSGVWSRQVLGSVEASIVAPPEIFAGRPTLFEVRLGNVSRIFPAYGLVIRGADGEVILAEACVGPGETRSRTVSLTFSERGLCDVGPWRLEVVLPLGFFVKSKEILARTRVLVYPALVPGPIEEGEHRMKGKGVEQFSGRGRHGDVFQLREFQDGDDRRQVHWKQTARQQRLIMVDRRRRSLAPLVYLLSDVAAEPDNPRVKAEFERRVSAVAVAVVRRLNRGEAVALEIGGRVYRPESRRAGARSLLEPLALARLRTAGEVAP